MRARSVRLSLLILVILVLSLLLLGFRDINIDIPGFPALERGGTGPLGLKLGLDLRGGGHLVYQADTSTRVDVEFPAPDPSRPLIGTGEVVVEPAEHEHQEDTVTPHDHPGTDAATGAGPTDGATVPEDSEQPVDAETKADVSGQEPGTDVEDAVANLIDGDFTVAVRGLNFFRIKMPLLEEEAVQDLREGLEERFGPALSFEVSEIGEPSADQMEGVLDIINRRVNRSGTEEPIIQLFGDDRIVVQLPGASGSVTKVRLAEPFGEGQVTADVREVLAAADLQNYTVIDGEDRSCEIR